MNSAKRRDDRNTAPTAPRREPVGPRSSGPIRGNREATAAKASVDAAYSGSREPRPSCSNHAPNPIDATAQPTLVHMRICPYSVSRSPPSVPSARESESGAPGDWAAPRMTTAPRMAQTFIPAASNPSAAAVVVSEDKTNARDVPSRVSAKWLHTGPETSEVAAEAATRKPMRSGARPRSRRSRTKNGRKIAVENPPSVKSTRAFRPVRAGERSVTNRRLRSREAAPPFAPRSTRATRTR
jgi:hypothetical protein